jgi:putative ABC transport system ATP-binding protein
MGIMCLPCPLTCCPEPVGSGVLTLRNGVVDLSDGDRRFRLELAHLELQSGRAVALTGASGSGKTLLLELLGLLRAPGAETEYRWQRSAGDADLAALWAKGARNPDLARMRGRLFGFVPQSGGLLPFLSVAENVALPQRLNACEDAEWCAALLDRLGLADVAGLMPGALSIGQRQRTAIARSLAHRPPFVIADEPTAALDPDSADTVLSLFLDMASDQGSGVILSSHDVDRVAGFGLNRLHLGIDAGVPGLVVSRLEPAEAMSC